MRILFFVFLILTSQIEVGAQTVFVNYKNWGCDTYEANRIDSVTFQEGPPGFIIYQRQVEQDNSTILKYSFNNINNISVNSKPYIETCDGTDFLSFVLTDGVSDYPAFAIIDTIILVKVPNQGDFSHLKAKFRHNGIETTVHGVVQESGISENDFSDSTNPVVYTVVSSEGKTKKYYIELFDIPVVYINTENKKPITNREDWIKAKMKIIDQVSDNCIEKEILIKGRGNGSWKREKKAYSIKFEEKESVLGLPKSKRWVLLGNSSDWTKLRTALSYKISSIAGFEWTPSGYNVDFILNDSLRCNYFISEQIRVEKNRINIKEMTPADTIGEALTGGVLFEVSSDYDELNKFKTDIGDFPFMFQNPDKDLQQIQFDYFKNYINSLESILYSDDRLMNNEFLNYMDIDTFIRWWLVHEITMNLEESHFVKNFYMYKDRGFNTKLTAGPPWDFDWGTYWKENEEKWVCKDKFWFGRLFLNPCFVSSMKRVWSELKQSYILNEVDSFFDQLIDLNRFSVTRDHYMFPKEYSDNNINNRDVNDEDGMPYEMACRYIKGILDNHMRWIDREIGNDDTK